MPDQIDSLQAGATVPSRFWIILAVLCLLISGCSPLNPPPGSIETRTVIQGQAFRHLLLTRNLLGAAANDKQPVFVFLENDGLPWQTPTIISNDPTPRHPVALALFRATPAPAIYLGRPCQWVGTFEAPCAPYFWTYGRFHPDVLNSLNAALEKILANDDRPLVLVGHSGGGTLATLIAHSMGRPVALVTLAAVLDHHAWTSRMSLTALTGSLNPAIGAHPGNDPMIELHVFGELDQVVKREDAEAYFKRFPVDALSVPKADHACCWASWWVTDGYSLALQLVHRLSRAKGSP